MTTHLKLLEDLKEHLQSFLHLVFSVLYSEGTILFIVFVADDRFYNKASPTFTLCGVTVLS